MLTQDAPIQLSDDQFLQKQHQSSSSLIFFYKKLIKQTSQFPYIKKLNELQTSKISDSARITKGKLITKKMRQKLLNWLQKLNFQTFRFSVQTFLLTIKVLDEYLSLTNQSPSSLQLIGSACIYLAAKTYETRIVACKCYVMACANIFSEKSLWDKEMQIYRTLNFNTNFPSLLKCYKEIEKNIKTSFFNNLNIKCLIDLIKQISKNSDFSDHSSQQIICAILAFVEVNERIPKVKEIIQFFTIRATFQTEVKRTFNRLF